MPVNLLNLDFTILCLKANTSHAFPLSRPPTCLSSRAWPASLVTPTAKISLHSSQLTSRPCESHCFAGHLIISRSDLIVMINCFILRINLLHFEIEIEFLFSLWQTRNESIHSTLLVKQLLIFHFARLFWDKHFVFTVTVLNSNTVTQ